MSKMLEKAFALALELPAVEGLSEHRSGRTGLLDPDQL